MVKGEQKLEWITVYKFRCFECGSFFTHENKNAGDVPCGLCAHKGVTASLERQNANLRGQITKLKKRLEGAK